LPDYPSEEGYVILAHKNYKTSGEWVELIDFAPSILSFLGTPIPEHMRGKKYSTLIEAIATI
jgi:bisphosphoglycerate-independent phosphoglycerate mutase (AlkP superfamily)